MFSDDAGAMTTRKQTKLSNKICKSVTECESEHLLPSQQHLFSNIYSKNIKEHTYEKGIRKLQFSVDVVFTS